MSKKERIEELERKVAELEAKLGNVWLIPTTKTTNIPGVWSNNGYCATCQQWYWGSHVCSGKPIKVTCLTIPNNTADITFNEVK